MNGLTLRIIRGGTKKSKNSIGFPPVILPKPLQFQLDEGCSEYLKMFASASSTDEQLAIVKNVLDESSVNSALFLFLAVVFIFTEAKHPVKCLITRHITKTQSLQQPFIRALVLQIKLQIKCTSTNYVHYTSVLPRLASCIENFPTGAVAVKCVDERLAGYLLACLDCCVNTCRETLSPTEKNEVFNLAHLALRLLLYTVQKADGESLEILHSRFIDIRFYIKQLMIDEDVPMDTKSLCGIIFLTIHIMENGSDSWLDVLNETNGEINSLLRRAAACRLCLHSSLATVVGHGLLAAAASGEPAVLALAGNIVQGAQGNCSDSAYTLGATRTLLQISKTLDKMTDVTVGVGLIHCLLPFVWGHLDHYMDSVRHLTAQLLDYIVKYCTRLQREGDDKALNSLFAALSSLDKHRKSYYVTMTSLCNNMAAARLMERVPAVIGDVMEALQVQAVQASATITLETLLVKHTRESNPHTIYEQWIVPILGHVGHVDSTVLSILEQLMTRAVETDDRIMDYILPHIKSSCDLAHPHDLKCVLMLVSVARRSRALAASESDHSWRGLIAYDVLKRAAVDANDETRILSLSLVVESSKTTEVFSAGELDYILWFLKYNMNAQSPNFRQLTLSLMKKFMKRLEDSFKVLKRQQKLGDTANRVQYYMKFVEDLRATCYGSLLSGANYSRRFVALQVLQWTEHMAMDGVHSLWTKEYVEKLLLHLEDSYENNKALALDILDRCPVEILKSRKYSVSLEMEDILREASSMKPTDCISAAYKLNFLRKKLPEHILQGNVCSAAEPVMFCLFRRLLSSLQGELSAAGRSIVLAARHGPMYGLLHCLRQLVEYVHVEAISEDSQWHGLVDEMVSVCFAVSAAAAPVVNSASPEGHLPMDASNVGVDDHGNEGGLVLEDGRPVTSQMVLLCAWRSVKEVSLLLGALSSRLTIRSTPKSKAGGGSLRVDQLTRIGEHFTALLAETKHRGAFEQAYVGFTKLLARLWRSRSRELHELPRRWLAELMEAIASGSKQGSLCATRRSAGLPFMIQALVTTELQVEGNPKCFHQCMNTLLRLASPPSLTKYRSKLSYSTKSNINISSSYSSENSAIQESHNNTSKTSSQSEIAKGSPSNLIENLQDDNVQESHDIVTKKSIQGNNEKESLSNNMKKSDDAISSGQGDNGGECQPNDGKNSEEVHEVHNNEVETRVHSLNILRALFRNSALDESVAGYVGEGIMVALSGFEGDTWAERNASTLAFSALMTRVFGVTRARWAAGEDEAEGEAGVLGARNKMTGRIFFLRYPQLYDFMLEKLTEARDARCQLRPSVYPALVLLGRLYPSSLEGTESSLRLAAFVRPVLAAARSPGLTARRLAAEGCVPLVHPLQYGAHLENLLRIISDTKIERNYCHGILLQVTRLLASRPAGLGLAEVACLQTGLGRTSWILAQAVGDTPCCLIADEYVNMINLMMWRYPSLLTQDFINNVENYLKRLLFETKTPAISSGREICLSNTMYLQLIILMKYNKEDIPQIVRKGLSHDTYEVVLANLNYLLILHKSLEVENKFQKHLLLLPNDDVLTKLRESTDYVQILCNVIKNNKYLECTQKALKVLTLEKDTQKYIVQVKTKIDEISDEIIIEKLLELIQIEHENMTHIYLESLSTFIAQKLKGLNKGIVLDVLRAMFACSSSDNGDNTRYVVAGFLENNFEELLKMDLGELNEETKFEFKATLWAIAVSLLEDDDEALRQRVCDVIAVTSSAGGSGRVLPCKAAETLREALQHDVDSTALFVVLALLDFKSEVCITDEISDECRVFDQNERYNIFLEETIWTTECANKIIQRHQGADVLNIVKNVMEHAAYQHAIDKLCNSNVTIFKKYIHGHTPTNKDVINPKIELFVNKLKN